jgi:hypothetical protein
MQSMNPRRKNGYALISIIVIGAFSLAFLLALASIVTSAVRAVSADKWAESLRDAAEVGIDYAVAKFNSENPCSLDPENPSGMKATLTTALTSQYLQSLPATSGIPNVQVSIAVTQILDSSYFQTLRTSSSIYSAQLDPFNTALAKSAAPTWLSPASAMPLNVTGGGYRIIESTATNGPYSRTIRVILKARFEPPPDGNPSPLLAGYASPSTGSYFNLPMFANQALQVLPNGALTVHGLNSASGLLDTTHTVNSPSGNYSAYDLNLTTNQQTQIGSLANIVGDVTVLSSASGANDVAMTPNGTIQGRLVTNGNPDTVTFDPSNFTVSATPGSVAQTTDTVKASADGGGRSGLNSSSPIQVNGSEQQIAQNQLAPVEVPSSPQALPQLSEIAQTLVPSTGGTSYEIAGLNTQSLSNPVVIQNQTNPATLFVDDSGLNSSQAIFLDTSKLQTSTTADARNLQIYYQGTDSVTINIANGGTFNGLIYAPNAPVTIQSSGSNSTFNGAVVGNSLNVTMSGTMNIYTDLGVSGLTSASGKANAAAGIQYQTATINGQQTILVQGWQPVTWQEFNPANMQ